MALLGAITAIPFSAYAQDQNPQRTLTKNLEYRFSFGDLPEGVKFQEGQGGSALVIVGAQELKEACQESPDVWKQDSFFNKLAHLHPMKTLSCRERNRPSVHARFVETATGQTQTWVHIDQCGPKHELCHFGEVIHNRLTFGRTSQEAVYRELVKENPGASADAQPSPSSFDYDAEFHRYIQNVFSPASIAETVAASGFGFAYGDLRERRFYLSPAGSLERTAIDGTLRTLSDTLFAVALRQDVAFKACTTCTGYRSRLRHALLGSFMVDAYGGHEEFPFSRLASAFTTAGIESEWHPWTREPISFWHRSMTILSWNVAKSLYREFASQPLKHLRSKMIGR